MLKKYKAPVISLGGLILIIVIALIAGQLIQRGHDPNERLRKNAAELKEAEATEAVCEYDPEDLIKKSGITVFKFTPSESAEYTFTADGIDPAKDIKLDLYVVDESMTEYLTASSLEESDDSVTLTDAAEGTAFLTGGQTYYVALAASPQHEATDPFTLPLTLYVSRGDGQEGPVDLGAGGKVQLSVKRDQKACAVFRPEETAFYDFDTVIVSKDAASGFSSVPEITSDAETGIKVTDGVAYLEAGRDYYVWVTVNESTKSRSDVELSCARLASASAHGECSVDIDGSTVIEYKADADMPLMISSASDGDPDAAVYDKEGFMLRSDDDSGETVSGNGKDFALGLNAKKGSVYWIYVDGKFAQCTVNIKEYKGDGTAPDPAE